MQLTRHTDYALRLLIYLAGIGDQRAQIAAVAEAQAISRTHLMKIANELARAGFIDATRGRGGGIRLARPPGEINLGAVIRAMEPPCPMVDCTSCRLVRRCSLPGVLDQASSAFRAVLERYSLADIVRERGTLLAA
ncbi:RrF2 family transcriptional regulator [Sphingomonas sp. TX0543]|uniref:RrF2 family transcriptional regulator n=1 Tax=Sphingomonas sp. TX0543 TaxID=3399682 RepID=UPI003AFB2609